MAASVVAAALSGTYPTLLPQWCLPPREAPLVGVQPHQDSATPADQPLDLSAKPKNSQVRTPSGVGRNASFSLRGLTSNRESSNTCRFVHAYVHVPSYTHVYCITRNRAEAVKMIRVRFLSQDNNISLLEQQKIPLRMTAGIDPKSIFK